MAATKGSKDDNEDSDEHDGAGLQGRRMTPEDDCLGGEIVLVPQKVPAELHPKVRNHGEGPY